MNQKSLEKGNFFFDWVVPVGIAFLIVLLINKFLIFQIKVPTGSMIPAIEKNDRLLVSRIYNYDSIKRGDVLVFVSREYNSQWFVKRVVGLPGETVDIDDTGKVYINGKELKEDYVKHPSPKEGHFKIPEGKYLMLGDNREISEDARYWNNPYIDKSDIKGKVRFTILPLDRIGTIK